MKTQLIVIDDIYTNPDDVREFALSQSFDVPGNYPGKRTKNLINEDTKKLIQSIVLPYSGQVVNWLDGPEGYSGAFQYTTCLDVSWIHSDSFNNWGGVIYLTPDAPFESGTGFFRSKVDGSYGGSDWSGLPGADRTKWDQISEVGNVYNRLILFAADQWHSSMHYFGDSLYDGRLTQVFFFQTER